MKELKCDKHKTYKGIRYPTSGCKRCIEIFNILAADRHECKSVTSPNFPCSPFHLLSEMSTCMVYGPQPAFFWRKATNASKDAKDHYKKIYKTMSSWAKNQPETFKQFKLLLYHIYGKYKKELIRNQLIEDQQKIKEQEREVQQEVKPQEDIREKLNLKDDKLRRF